MHALEDIKLAIIGLGYVGLPLAVEFGKQRRVVGFDVKESRIKALRAKFDATHEVPAEDLAAATGLYFSSDPTDLAGCNCYIVAVPTPVDDSKRPDLSPLLSASQTVGNALKNKDLVIYESTVFPGATEDVCVPILEECSGLHLNTGFFVGYSPERINPGDQARRLPDVVKVTSGSTSEASELIDALYATIVPAGTHRAESIRVAEAAKVIENIQRDLNIALVNELAMIFNKLALDTDAVLRAAGTKWNFLPFRPGLVGGHCIGVDPYYLTYKAQTMGHHPEIILAGRRINDSMGEYVTAQLIKAMLKKYSRIAGARVLVLGFAFKENCHDVRNTRVIDVVRGLQDYGVKVDVHDPWIVAQDALAEYEIALSDAPETGIYDAVLLAVAHSTFVAQGAEALRAFGKPGHVFFDLKSCFGMGESDLRL